MNRFPFSRRFIGLPGKHNNTRLDVTGIDLHARSLSGKHSNALCIQRHTVCVLVIYSFLPGLEKEKKKEHQLRLELTRAFSHGMLHTL